MLRRTGSISALGLVGAAVLGVCLAQQPGAQPPAIDSLHAAATVVTVSGQVSVLRDSQPWALAVGSQVRPRQIIVTGSDGYALFKLADGSTFEIFPNARLTFRDNPGDWSDLLELLLGRIKVHIQKWGGQPNPNKVRTPTALISVRGTTFDVVVQDSDSTIVSVEEGQVQVRHRLQPGEPKLVNPGESLTVYKDQPLAKQGVDKGGMVHAALRAMADAIYTTIYRTPRGAAPVPGGGSAPLPGDTKNPGGQTPPPPPPPPPPDSGPPPPPGP